MDDNYKIKPLRIMLPKKQTKWMYFLIEGGELLKNIIIFGIESAIV